MKYGARRQESFELNLDFIRLIAEFGFVDNVETISIWEVEKSLAIQIESHAISEADKPFLEVIG